MSLLTEKLLKGLEYSSPITRAAGKVVRSPTFKKYFTPKTGVVAQAGNRLINNIASTPISPQLQAVGNTLNKFRASQNPFVQLPQQFAGGMVQGSNLGMGGAPSIQPQTLGQQAAFTAGNLVGAFNPKSITGRFYQGVNTLTNPAFSKLTGTASRVINPRVAGATANVIQGIGIDKTLGQPTTPTSLGIDVVTGLAMGPNQFDDIAKTTVKGANALPKIKVKPDQVLNKRQTILNLAKLREFGFRSGPQNEINMDALKVIDDIHAEIYGLPSRNKRLRQLDYNQKVDDLVEALNQYTVQKNMSDAGIKMGIQDQNLRKPPPGSYTNVRQIDNKLAPKDFSNTNPAKQVLEDQSVARDFERSMNQQNVKAKVNLVDYLRTPQNVLKKIGLEKQGKELQKGYENYRLELNQELDKINTWFRQAPDPQSSENIFRHLDGEKVDLSPTEKKLATEIRGYLKGWAKRLGLPEDKQIKNYITHLFDDQLIQKEFDPELAKLIDEKVPGSVYDPFLQKRYGIDGYKTDVWQALDAYVKRGVRKANMDPALERLQEASKSLDLESYKYIQRLASRVNLRPTEIDNLLDNFIKSTPIGYKLTARPTAKITRNIRNTIYRATLGLNIGSAVRNLSQGVNTYAKLGEKYTLIGYSKLIGKFASRDWDELKRVGVLEDNIVQDRHISAMKGVGQKIDSTLWVFFDLAEKINRGSAYFGAKSKALAKGMNEDQAIEYAKKIVKDTQFSFGSVDTPVALSSDLVKTLAQFQSYNIKQAEFLGGMIKNKELGGIIRYIGATLAISASVGKLFGYGPGDALPFADLVGEGKFTSPLGQLVETTHGLLSPDEDKRKSAVRDLPKAASLLIPGGVQAKKTIEGLNTANKGYSETSTGRVRFPVEQSTSNKVRAGLFGQWNLPEAREYFDKDRSVLGEQQSTYVKNAQDKQGAYNQIMSTRDKNRLVDQIKESLGKGKKPDSQAQKAEFTFGGSTQNGYVVDDRFIYMDDGEVKTKSVESIRKTQRTEERGIIDAKYSLTTDRLKRNNNIGDWMTVTGQYIQYLQSYMQKLDPKTEQKQLISTQNKIEDLIDQYNKYAGYGGFKKGSSGKKSISDAQLLSAYKKALSAANAPTNYKISNFTNQLNQLQVPRLKRQVIRPLR